MKDNLLYKTCDEYLLQYEDWIVKMMRWEFCPEQFAKCFYRLSGGYSRVRDVKRYHRKMVKRFNKEIKL